MMKKLLCALLGMLLLLGTALADIDASNAPVIPTGTLSASIVQFTSNQTYAVYSAPDSKSIRGAKGRARVSTNGWIQVFGSDGDWLLVQYDITDKHNRIGYIYKNALPKDVVVPELALTNVPAVVNYDVAVTDDPLVSQTPLARLTENTSVTVLGTMGDWTYIEGEENSVRFRGFVPTACLSGTVTDLREANRAIVGSWRLYAGSSINASRISFREDGRSGNWSLLDYDPARGRYWNDTEFELTLTRGSAVEQYGLRICRQATENGGYKYALVLSDGPKSSGMVLCE